MNIEFINKDFQRHFYDTILPTIETLESSKLDNYFKKIVGPLVKFYQLEVDDMIRLGKFRKQLIVPLRETSHPVLEIKGTAPKGITNKSGVDCAFNSVVQTLRVIPKFSTKFHHVDISNLRNLVQLGNKTQVDAGEILDKLGVNLLYVAGNGKSLTDEKKKDEDVEKVTTDKNGIPLGDKFKDSDYLFVTGYIPPCPVSEIVQGKKLTGGLIHTGSENDGHWVAIVEQFDRWYFCDDGYVEEMEKNVALNRLKNASTRLYLSKKTESASEDAKHQTFRSKDYSLMETIFSLFKSIFSFLFRS